VIFDAIRGCRRTIDHRTSELAQFIIVVVGEQQMGVIKWLEEFARAEFHVGEPVDEARVEKCEKLLVAFYWCRY